MSIVQIYGVSFCGSTMIDLMIGNDPSGKNLSCGEVYAIFGRRKNDPVSSFWEEVRGLGQRYLYKKLINHYGYRIISDSSKKEGWLRKREAEALTDGIPVYKIVMFKSPEGWVGSMLKRGNAVRMDGEWVRYYRSMLNSMPDALYVEYKTLATNPEKTLKYICDSFNIPYFNGKSRYWETPNTQVFGNANARHGKKIKYSEDRTHIEYNTKNSDLIYNRLKEKAIGNK